MSGKMAEKPKDKYDPHPIGRGKLRWDKDVPKYIGSFPFYEGEEEVVMLRRSDLENICHAARHLLFSHHAQQMPDVMIESLPDCFTYTLRMEGKKDQTVDLLLEQRIYTADPEKEMWFRYVTIEESFREEPSP